MTFAGIAAVVGLALAFVLVGRFPRCLGEASRPVADGPARVAVAPPPVIASPASSSVVVPEAVPVAPAVASSVAPRRFVPASLPPVIGITPIPGEPRVAPVVKTRDPYANSRRRAPAPSSRATRETTQGRGLTFPLSGYILASLR